MSDILAAKKIFFIIGTRPEAIKMAPLIIKLKEETDFNVVLCVSGQHKEMLYQVLTIFDLYPDYDLDVMQPKQDLYDITSKTLMCLRDVLKKEKPEMVLVHGDTATAFSGALAAFYEQIPVGHVEAGLRTYNIYSPWPEEMYRQLVSRIACMHFTPTELSKDNLKREGISEDKIYITGNTVIDALNSVLNKINVNPDIKHRICRNLVAAGLSVEKIKQWEKGRKIILITAHRRENFGQGLQNIGTAILQLTHLYPHIDFIYPMHLNPVVRNTIKDVLRQADANPPNLFLIEPLEYLEFSFLMSLSLLVLTDSGGIQEEAPSLGKPVLVMRNTTERPEAVTAGTVKLVGTDISQIIETVSALIENMSLYESMSNAINPYGDGSACDKILAVLHRECV
ncbi:MAG: UDP-N-acetylglucosamine 2-epimerase (non-hydrolyzing) [Coprobacter sp.]|nr:UDP-N-acetylglucosamine 2-epimerase (non-hydrolyzing) [Coprobacter sp.]